MKKYFLAILGVCSLIVLTSCGSRKDLSEYVNVDFYGIDTRGNVSYTLDTDKLFKDVLDLDVAKDWIDVNKVDKKREYF